MVRALACKAGVTRLAQTASPPFLLYAWRRAFRDDQKNRTGEPDVIKERIRWRFHQAIPLQATICPVALFPVEEKERDMGKPEAFICEIAALKALTVYYQGEAYLGRDYPMA